MRNSIEEATGDGGIYITHTETLVVTLYTNFIAADLSASSLAIACKGLKIIQTLIFVSKTVILSTSNLVSLHEDSHQASLPSVPAL